MTRDDDKLDELLAGGVLSGPQYDDVLERVLARTPSAPARARRPLLWIAGGVIASSVAAWLLLARTSNDPFTAKGAGTTQMVDALQVGCAPAGGRVCHPGDTLMFTVNSALVSGSLGAYAERSGDPARERIWYFPTGGGASPTIVPGAGTVAVPEGIQIGPEHRPGRYRVTVWIASRPLDRRDIDRAAAAQIRSRAVLDLEVAP